MGEARNMEATVLQEALRTRVCDALGRDPFGPAVHVVTPAAATLAWERELLRGLGGGSLRLRVETPARLALALMQEAGEPCGVLARRQLMTATRIAAAEGGILAALGEGVADRPGAEALLAATLEAAWWQAPGLPDGVRDALGPRLWQALQAASQGVREIAAAAGLIPEPLAFWRAAGLVDKLPWPGGTVFWPEGPMLPAEAALRGALGRAGMLAQLPAAIGEAPRAGVAVELRGAHDARAEVRFGARRCLDLLRDGVAPQDILVGCGDFPLQAALLRSALAEAGVTVDAGPEPARGEPALLLAGGLLDMAQGRTQEGLLALAASGLLPAPGRLRDDLLRHVRDGGEAAEGVAGFLAGIAAELRDWPHEAPLAEHTRRLVSLLTREEVLLRLQAGDMGRQAELLRSFDDGLDTAISLAGDSIRTRPLALRLISDALLGARLAYQPSRGAVRVVPLGDMAGLEADHVLLLGLAEGRFPQLGGGPSLLSALQLGSCEALGLPLAEPPADMRRRGLAQVAAALAAARRTLYASCAEIDGDGRVQAPAFALRRLGDALPETRDTPLARACAALTRQEAGEIIAEALAQARDIGGDMGPPSALLGLFTEVSGKGAHLTGLAPAQPPGPGPGAIGPFTVTALERRAACPFISFTRDMLRVEPGRRAGFDPAARGALVHQVLRDLPLDAPPAAEQEATVAALVADAAQALGVLGQESPAGRCLRQELTAEVLRTARLVWEEGRRSSFRPVGREVGFGRRGALPPLALAGPGGAANAVEGRIDRLDSLDGRLRVVDYKVRRHQPFAFARVFHGLDLQIGAYALAAAQGGGAPVAMLYWPVRLGQSWVVDEDEDDPDGEWRAQRPKGLFLADPQLVPALDREAPGGGSPFHPLRLKKDGQLQSSQYALAPARWQALLDHVREELGRLAAAAQAGAWEPSPYALQGDTACKGCELRPACRHVPARDGFRRLRPVKQEVLDDGPSDA